MLTRVEFNRRGHGDRVDGVKTPRRRADAITREAWRPTFDFHTGDAGGAGAYQRERGQRTVLRDLGLLDDREKRFRARRRLCWIGQRDPGSMLSRLPAHVLDEVVPYFDPAPRAAV